MAARAQLRPTAMLLLGAGGYVVGKSVENQTGGGGGGPSGFGSFLGAVVDMVGKSNNSSSDSLQALNREVSLLSDQMRALSRSSQGPTIVQVSGPSPELMGKGVGGLALTAGALYSYCYFRGIGYNDLAYVSKSFFSQTVSELKCRVQQVTASLSKLREDLLAKILKVEKAVERSTNHLEATIEKEVGSVRQDLEEVNKLQKNLKNMVGNLTDKVSTIEGQTRFSSRGIYLLCNIVSKNVTFRGSSSEEHLELQSFANKQNADGEDPLGLCDSPSRLNRTVGGIPLSGRRRSMGAVDVTPIVGSKHWLENLCFTDTPSEKRELGKYFNSTILSSPTDEAEQEANLVRWLESSDVDGAPSSHNVGPDLEAKE